MVTDDEDAPDLDQIQMLVRSVAYRAIAKRHEVIVGQKLADLVQDLDPLATAKARGYIEGVRACQRLPEQLQAEMEERRKKRKQR